MRIRTLSTLCLLLLISVLPAAAQDADAPTGPVYVVTTHQCDWSQLETVVQHHQERMLPLGQALADEGTVRSIGAGVHTWGDNRNYITWVSAPDLQAVLAGTDQLNARYAEAHPSDDVVIAACPQHQDNFYQGQVLTQPRAASEEMASSEPASAEEPPVLAVSYFSCDYRAMDTLIEWERDRVLPIAQDLVDDGSLMSREVYTHLWGDEWNYVVTRAAKNLPTLLEANDREVERYEETYGEAANTMFGEHCTNHKDNIYTITMATE
ncbi:MAG: hypothetical protein GVY12_14330 [Bacteroidetes bacterium]|nr:hypothetical protein [Bacteroidota bacterium]